MKPLLKNVSLHLVPNSHLIDCYIT